LRADVRRARFEVRMGVGSRLAIVAALWLSGAGSASAQQVLSVPVARPDRTIDVNWGYTAFRNEGERFEHTVLGGGFRVPVLRRLAVGAEVLHLRGPGFDRDWVFAGKATFDLVPDGPDQSPIAVPYLVGGGGFLRHSNIVNDVPVEVNTGIGNGGAGVRIALGKFLYIAPEFRVGLEPHWHFGLVIGVKDKRRRQ
jgi:hypothetical protein